MAPLEPPDSIVLRVKVPPGHLSGDAAPAGGPEEYLLGAINTTATIGTVRQRIRQLVPSNPAPENQRLLYAGRALVNNEQSLADALNTKRDPTQHEYVIHLLVRGDGLARATPATLTTTSGEQREPAVPQAPVAGQMPSHLIHPLQATPLNPQQVHVMQHQQALMRHQQQVAQIQMQMMGQGAGQHPAWQGGITHASLNRPMHMPSEAQAHGFAGAPSQALNTNTQPTNTSLEHPNTMLQPPTHHNANQDLEHTESNLLHPPTTSGPEQSQRSSPDNNPTQPIPNLLSSGHPNVDLRRPVSGQGFHFEGIGPNGQRVQIHQQTMYNVPMMALPGLPNSGIPGAGFVPMPRNAQTIPSMPPPQQVLDRRMTALERSRRDLIEMGSTLNELRETANITDDQRRRIEEAQQRIERLSDYVDPFHLGPNRNQLPQSTIPAQQPQAPMAIPTPRVEGPGPFHIPHQFPPPLLPTFAMQPPPASPTAQNITCYLLSSPQGAQALLFSPEHGTYTGTMPMLPAQSMWPAGAQITPTPTIITAQMPNQAADAAQRDPVEVAVHQRVQAAVAEQAQQQAQGQEPFGVLQPLLGHLWLLLRVLIFAYFFLGSNLGWHRPLLLLAIGVGFWLVRMGFVGQNAPLRRWWDGIVQMPQQQRGAGQGQNQPQGQQQGQNQQTQRNVPASQQTDGARRAGAMPTPEQVAQRLLDEDAARRQNRGNWLREQLRPAERMIALFVASLWPGVGEAQFRERQREQRRQQEEEEQRRRAEVEAREAANLEEQSKTAGEQSEPVENRAESSKDAGEAPKAPAGAGQSDVH